MSKQTFRKNINSRTTKMKAVTDNSFSVVVTSVQKIDKSTQIMFSIDKNDKNDNITMDIFPRDTDTESFMSTNFSSITEIQISETLYKFAGFLFLTLNFTLRFAVSNPRIRNNGSSNSYRFDVNNKVYTNLNDGLTKPQGEGWLLASVYLNNDVATWVVKKFTEGTAGTLRESGSIRSNDFTLYLSNGVSFNKTSS